MKREEHDVLHYAEERYIEEADPAKMVSGKRSRRGVYIALAACLALLLVVGVLIGTPFMKKYMEGLKYKDSAYSLLIARLDVLKTKHEEDLTKGEDWVDKEGAMSEPAEDLEPEIGEGNYEEVTDNQVSGVIEGDRFKRSDRYIYYLDDETLYVYSIEGEDSQKVGWYHLPDGEKGERIMAQGELYLSKDCTTVTLFYSLLNTQSYERSVQILSLDVRDPQKITLKNKVRVPGSYISSRTHDGRFLVMTTYTLNLDNVDFEEESTFVPTIKCGQEEELVAPENICFPKELEYANYTVLTLLDENTLEPVDTAALLSYTTDPYITAENVFTHRCYSKNIETGADTGISKRYTELLCLSYGQEGFEVKKSIEMEGYLKDRYSLDEYDGVLRAVTTTTQRPYQTSPGSVHYPGHLSEVSANLYCIDLESMTVCAQVTGFAPNGETVQSVRFEGTNAYVCTAIVFTDPVFFFDLSDLSNITYKQTVEIEGFSSSLVNFEKGNLLGIGMSDGWDTLKVEIYREGQENVESVSIFEMQDVYFAGDYKAYYIDRTNQLVGLGYCSYTAIAEETRYLVLHFDGTALKEVANVELNGSAVYQRGVYIDGYYYFLGDDDFQVHPLVLE